MEEAIKTERLVIRKISENDLDAVYTGLSHPEVIRYYGVSYGNREQTREQIKWFEDLESSGTGRWWALCSEDNTVFYGAAGFNNRSAEHRKAELGFWLLPQYWGKGIIQEAIPVILTYGYDRFDLHRIEALVETGNSNSSRALVRMGFQKEGLMRDCEIKNDRFISIEIYAKLKSD